MKNTLMQNDQNKHFLVIYYFVFFNSPGHRDVSFLQIMTSGVFEKCFQTKSSVRTFEQILFFDEIR